MYSVTGRLGAAGSRARKGFTLLELLLVAVLVVLVVGGMLNVLVRQQRFYRGTADLLEARSQTRQVAGILPAELRGISSVGGDILAMSDTELQFRATVGSSVVCAISGGEIVLPPTNPAKGNVVSNWGKTPAPGDTILIFTEGAASTILDDSWTAYEIGSPVSTVTGACPTSSGLTTAADASKSHLKFGVVGGLGSVGVGAPMRFVRHARYTLYAAPNGSWYLGYCSPTCGPSGPEPIAGPFVASSEAGSGIRFTYLNVDGAVTAVPDEVVQVSVLIHAQTRSQVNIGGLTKVLGDSVRFTVGIRNSR